MLRTFRCTALSIAILSVLVVATPLAQAQAVVQFDLPAQPLADSLRAVAKQTNSNVLFDRALVRGRKAPALKAEASLDAALNQLLDGSGLKHQFVDEKTVTVVDPTKPPAKRRPDADARAASTPTASNLVAADRNDYMRLAQAETGSRDSSSPEVAAGASEPLSERRIELEEIIVTGTNIRGVYPSSSPMEIYTAEDIRRTGATTTEQFIERLPQNQGTRTQYTGSATSQLNRESITSVDLRGLGVGTTLTLLNGRRLTLANFGRTADISMIPLSAIERIEVLTDGASAVYGSDAIGGVVNFVLRDDFDGAETALSYGGVTSGGLRQRGLTQTFGRNWGVGRGLLSFDVFSASPLQNADRTYAVPAGPGYLTSDDRRSSALLTLSQDIGQHLQVHGDFIYSRRDADNLFTDLTSANPLNHSRGTLTSSTEQFFANAGAAYEFNGNLRADVLMTYSRIDVDSSGLTSLFNRALDSASTSDTEQSALDLTAMLSGTLLALPGGALQFSIGSGYISEDYLAARTAAGAISGRDLGRDVTYAFGELLIPLVGSDQSLPLVHRLELSLAARYTAYDDDSEPALGRTFGGRTTPKVGLSWAPTSSLNLRGTYGESFRAPALTEVDSSSATNTLRTGFLIGGIPSTAMFLFGPSPELESETAESYTVGFDFGPQVLSGLRVSGTYFNIDYGDRILAPSTVAARANPAAWPDLVYAPGSAGEVERFLRTTRNTLNNTGIVLTDPVAASMGLFASPNLLIVDERIRNLALSRLDGFDLSTGARFATRWGAMSLGVQLTRIFDYREQATSTAPVFRVLDTVLRPMDWRGRFYAGLARAGFDSTVSVNYVDDYSNPLSTGDLGVQSWTTVDWNLSYDFGTKPGFFSGVKLRLSVLNLLDEDPPFIGRNADIGLFNPAGFDPANANPLGRFVLLGVAKTW